MRRVLLLAALALALTGAECSSPDGSVHETFAAGVPAAPIPEPSGALIFAVGLVLVAWKRA